MSYFETELDRRRFIAALIASAVAAGVPLPLRAEQLLPHHSYLDYRLLLEAKKFAPYFVGSVPAVVKWLR